MAPAKRFERNVRPQRLGHGDDVDDSDDVAQDSEVGSESGSEGDLESSDADEQDRGQSNEALTEDEEDDGGEDPEEDAAQIKAQLNNVSFGALKEAQESMSRKRKRGSDTNLDQEDKLEALRARLRQIRQAKEHQSTKSSKTSHSKSARRVPKNHDSASNASDSDSAPSEAGFAPRARSSKHAPTSQTSRRQVTRRRQVIDVPKRGSRDPRFDAVAPPTSRSEAVNAANQAHGANKAYAFLRTYQESEIAELGAALKRAKTEEDRTVLRRKMVSLQNTLKNADARAREREVVAAHRRAERAALADGSKAAPYFLKRREVQERALAARYAGMKSKERERAMARKREKDGQREKRRMPTERRRMG